MQLHDQKVELLRTVDIFSPLREYELDIIARHSEMVEFQKKDIIFTQGSEAAEMYAVKSGRVGIINVESEEIAVVAQIAEGETFGELDFLGKSPRSALAMAEENSLLLRFPSTRYRAADIFSEHPYIFASLLFRLLGIITGRIVKVNESLDEKQRWILDLKKQLLCDKLTGLYNQVFLKEEFPKLLASAPESAALIMIKPDNFKEINDRFGHRAGDQLLRLMAIFLQSELGEDDAAVRFRGDEFAALIFNVDKQGAIARAKSIMKTYKTLDVSEITAGVRVQISASVGIALYPKQAFHSDNLIDCAVKKMYKARDGGGARIVI